MVDASRIAGALERAADSGEVPGVAAAAATKDGVIFEGGYGKRDLAYGRADVRRYGGVDRLDDQGDHLRLRHAADRARQAVARRADQVGAS